MNRRRARALVLSIFATALFVGPWTNAPDLSDLVGGALNRPTGWTSILWLAVVMAPLACLASVLAPKARWPAVTYRVLTGGSAAAFCVAFMLRGWPSIPDLIEFWGALLYLVTLPLALAVEMLPVRRTREPDYGAVFR